MDRCKRGEIFYIIKDSAQVGSEIYHGRPAVIVSNDFLNATAAVVEVVFLTTQPRKEMGTHVKINSTGRTSTACCEQITSVAVEKLGDYVCSCTDQEMQEIDVAIARSLALTPNPPREMVLRPSVTQAEFERDFYKTQYENLISKLMQGGLK